MMHHPPSADKPFTVLQEIDTVLLRPGNADGLDQALSYTRESIERVFLDFLAVQKIAAADISLIDGFLFIFNETEFTKWHTLSWWDQRKLVREIKDHHLYMQRAHALLSRSSLAPYIDYSDDMVARSTDQEVKRAWMRKRLVHKECFWNAIDSFSHAAYFQKKYQGLYPALCVLLCKVVDWNGREFELVLGIDNGTGFLYKKKSRESSMIRCIYKVYKYFFTRGVFYIGGLELGLIETDGRLSCHGSGAVVYQGW